MTGGSQSCDIFEGVYEMLSSAVGRRSAGDLEVVFLWSISENVEEVVEVVFLWSISENVEEVVFTEVPHF